MEPNIKPFHWPCADYIEEKVVPKPICCLGSLGDFVSNCEMEVQSQVCCYHQSNELYELVLYLEFVNRTSIEHKRMKVTLA